MNDTMWSSIDTSIATTDTNIDWTRDDIKRLFVMAKRGVRHNEMGKALGRNPFAVRHALRKMITQQCVFHPAEDVAAIYHMDIYDFHRILAPKKYYVSIDKADPPMTKNTELLGDISSTPWCLWMFTVLVVGLVGFTPFVTFD